MWEYQMKETVGFDDDLIEFMNKLGKDRWEIISIDEIEQYKTVSIKYRLYMKRLIK